MLNRPISLIPVTLTEASHDTPTFRGTVIHYAEQLALVEAWIDEYIKATTRLTFAVTALEGLVNTYIAAGNPVGLSESMMDHDYTLLALTRYAEGARGFWGAVMRGAQKAEVNVVDKLVAFRVRELKAFKEIRRTLETTQSRYDLLLSRYSAQSKTKEPSSLREDAFQVYEARKLYIHSCLDFCVAAPTFKAALDKLLVRIFSDQSREQLRVPTTLDRHAAEIDRVRAWSDGMESSSQIFRAELVSARKELEERAKREWQPARDLEEYAVSTVPYLTSRPNVPEEKEGKDTPSVKQGWLFMRAVLAGKPGTRTNWIRRWFFVKDGVFGWLVQGFKDGAMEESEKIGVLLCNIKPAFQEERRFCFEVKTKDTTVLLQAETQVELMSWLAVFEQAKRTAVENTGVGATQAFSIIPPSAAIPPAEPAYITRGHDGTGASAAVSTSKDGHGLSGHLRSHLHKEDAMKLQPAATMPATELTLRATSIDISSADAAGPSGTREKIAQKLDIRKPERSLSPNPSPITPLSAITTGAGFSALISASHNALPFHPSGDTTRFGDTTTTLAPTTLANTPAPVMLSKAAAVTSGPSMNPAQADLFRGHRKTQSLDTDIGLSHAHGGHIPPEPSSYPSSYPTELVAQDAHWRTLFPHLRSAEEIVLLVFRATWAAGKDRELPGRCYVTARRLYFYSHWQGLVFTSVVSLAQVLGVSVERGRDWDCLWVQLQTEGEGDEASVQEEGVEEERICVRVYLEPVRLLQKRLLLLVKTRHEEVDNGAKVDNAALLSNLLDLEKEEDAAAAAAGGSGNQMSSPTESWEDLGSDGEKKVEGRVKEVVKVRLPREPISWRPRGGTAVCVLTREFEVAAKALWIVVCGEKSGVWGRLYAERRAGNIQQSPWRTDESGQLRREFAYEIDYTGFLGAQKKSAVSDYQNIEVQDDHLLYVLTDKKTPWHLPHRERFMLVTKVVVSHVAKSRCRLSIWTDVEWSNVPAFSKGIIHRQAISDLSLDAEDLADILSDAVRSLGTLSGRTKTALSMFGDIVARPYNPSSPSSSSPITQPLPPIPTLRRMQTTTRIQQRRLARMIAETVLSFLESAASSVIMWTCAGAKSLSEVVSAQRILMGVLVACVVWNVLVGRMAVGAWWSERRADRWLSEMGASVGGGGYGGREARMSRSVWLRDLEVAGGGNGTWGEGVWGVWGDVGEGAGMCHSAFLTLTSSTDLDVPISAHTRFSSPSTRATAHRLRSGRQHLGSYRHDLLVALRVVNSLEREMVRAEWDNFVVEERARCEGARGWTVEEVGGEVMEWVGAYCGSCEVAGRGLGV